MKDSPDKIDLNVDQSSLLLKLGIEPVEEKNNIGKKNEAELLIDMLALNVIVKTLSDTY
jgi:hypothetical protein